LFVVIDETLFLWTGRFIPVCPVYLGCPKSEKSASLLFPTL
jgi:hypothetical protein